MSDKNFEQSVRSKMDELSFRPSDDVWTKVEAELDHGKKRRRIWLWIPVAAALLGLVWIGIQHVERPGQTAENKAQQLDSRMQDAEGSSGKPGKNFQEKNSNSPVQGSSVRDEQSNVQSSDRRIKDEESNTQNVDRRIQDKESNAQNVDRRIQDEESKAQNSDRRIQDVEIRNNLAGKKSQGIQSEYKKNVQIVETSNDINAAILGIDIERRNYVFAMPGLSTSLLNSSLIAATKVKPGTRVDARKKDVINNKNDRKKKWNFYASGSAGISGVNDGGLLDMRTALSDYASPSPVANYGGGRGLSNNYAVILRPVSPGVFVNLQAGVERSIARKWSLGAALGYSRFSTSMKDVGWDKRTINMNYGLLDLPVTLSFHQRSFDLNAGIVSSGIISYKVNQSPTNSISVTDADDLNRMQFGLIAGADIRVFKKSNHQIKIGPTFRYQFTNLLNNNISAQHLASGAIHLKWYLNK